MYPEQIVIPMKEELTENGFEDLATNEKKKKRAAPCQGDGPGKT